MYLLVKNLNYNPNGKFFSQDASMLGLPPGQFPSQVKVHNPKTRVTKTFTHQRTNPNAMEYTCDNLTLAIYND